MKLIFKALHGLRAPVFVSVFSCLIFALPPQTQEIYRSVADNIFDSIYVASISVLLIGIYIWLLFVASTSIILFLRLSSVPFIGYLPIAIALVPFLGILSGLENSKIDAEAPEIIELNSRLSIAEGALITIVVFVFFLCRKCRNRTLSSATALSRGYAGLYPVFISILLFVLTVLTVKLWGATTSVWVGPIGTVACFLILFLLLLSSLSMYYERTGYPIIFIASCLAIVFSMLGLNANHDIRLIGQANSEKPAGLEESFIKWIQSRADVKQYTDVNAPYPVYIVSAEGGGIYAAYNAAMLMARIQDSCPRFAQHLFAISGVSGGSIGAGVFAAEARFAAKNTALLHCGPDTVTTGEFQRDIDRFFDTDLLSPLVASALFTDLFQRILPFRISSFDRARSLEYSIEAGWLHATDRDDLSSGFRDTFSTAASVPALILNTTEVSQGRQEILAPFAIDLPRAPASGAYLGARQDLPLSTAMVASARFPWLTPAGTYSFWGTTLQLADGGYYENSGVDTAYSIIEQLVRRQNIWHNSGRKLAECGPRLGVDVRRPACGEASADVRWSVV